jgi:DNA repair photolyase
VVSFTTDPYQPRELTEHLTRKTLETLARRQLPHRVMLLSKSVLMEEDFPFFKLWHSHGFDIWVGTTLTSVIQIPDEPYSSNADRIVLLQRAHNLGLPTWVSIEPWLPDKTYPRQIIEATHEFVDWYVIGRLNYVKRLGYPEIPKGYYKEEIIKTEELLTSLDYSLSQRPCKKGYWIKKELRKEV